MLKTQCECGEVITEEQLKPHCDRCDKLIEENMLGDAVQVLVAPGDDDPEGEGPQFLMVMSGDINGEPDGHHYCMTCTTRLLDQSFYREMSEAAQEAGVLPEPDGEEDEGTDGSDGSGD